MEDKKKEEMEQEESEEEEFNTSMFETTEDGLELQKFNFYEGKDSSSPSSPQEIQVQMYCRGRHMQHSKRIGEIVWPGAEVLSQYIIQNMDKFKGKNVLELGAGPGLCGMLCAKKDCNVVFTDCEDEVLDLLKQNKTLNNLSNDKTFVEYLRWGEKVQEFCDSFRTNKHILFHVIIASDVIYSKHQVQPLLLTIKNVLQYTQDHSESNQQHQQQHPLFCVLANGKIRYNIQNDLFVDQCKDLGLDLQQLDEETLYKQGLLLGNSTLGSQVFKETQVQVLKLTPVVKNNEK